MCMYIYIYIYIYIISELNTKWVILTPINFHIFSLRLPVGKVTLRSQTANQFTFDPPQWLLLIMGILVLIACILLGIWILTKISVSVVTEVNNYIIITIQNNNLNVII